MFYVDGVNEVKVLVKGMWLNCEVFLINDVFFNFRKCFKNGFINFGFSDDLYVFYFRVEEMCCSRNLIEYVYLDFVCYGCIVNVFVV